jgi:hypothetical protein
MYFSVVYEYGYLRERICCGVRLEYRIVTENPNDGARRSCNGAAPYGNGGLRAQVDIRVRVPGHRSREQSRAGTGAAATKLRKAIRCATPPLRHVRPAKFISPYFLQTRA